MGDCPTEAEAARLRPALSADDNRYGRKFNRDRVPTITDADGSGLRLLSRNGNGSYPELGVVAGWVAHPGHPRRRDPRDQRRPSVLCPAAGRRASDAGSTCPDESYGYKLYRTASGDFR